MKDESPARERAEALYRAYAPTVNRFCEKLLKDPELARDATQEVFLRLLKHADRFEGGEEVLPWIFTVTRNHCLNLRRDDRLVLVEAGEGPEPVTHADEIPRLALAHRILERFDAPTRSLAMDVLAAGVTHEDAAAARNLSRATVARRMDRFLEKSRSYLVPDERFAA